MTEFLWPNKRDYFSLYMFSFQCQCNILLSLFCVFLCAHVCKTTSLNYEKKKKTRHCSSANGCWVCAPYNMHDCIIGDKKQNLDSTDNNQCYINISILCLEILPDNQSYVGHGKCRKMGRCSSGKASLMCLSLFLIVFLHTHF